MPDIAALPLTDNNRLRFVPIRRCKSEWADILKEVAHAHGYTVEDLIGPRKFRALVIARREAMWQLRQTGMSTPRIGLRLGNRDHTTVLWGLKRRERAA